MGNNKCTINVLEFLAFLFTHRFLDLFRAVLLNNNIPLMPFSVKLFYFCFIFIIPILNII